MQKVALDPSRFHVAPARPRNQRSDLIEQIIERTTDKDKAKLARCLAIAANTMKWSITDLHALLKKADDPSIRNYTAFVWRSGKVKRAANE